ncbi:MAG: hypothetical protein K2L98_01835, partial [Bacilli bacterium]|nr:hypothetical protein [Bacilli bacterium]
RWKKKQVASWIEAIKNYGNINEDIQSRSKTKKICQKLLELSNKGRELANSKRENKAKFDQLRKEFISLLEQEMEEKYREEGIDEIIEIQSATVTANSVNLLSLELKGESDKNQG